MERNAIQLLFVAALVAVAGCAGGVGGGFDGDPATDDTTDPVDGTDAIDGDSATATFYVSDEPNQIDDFEHLNVTVTKVGFKKTGDVADERTDANETDGESEGEPENETREASGAEESGEPDESDGAADERWIEYDVDEKTVDLTELKGANATALDEFELPEGEYETVFIYVSDTEGILTDGTETNVKLPSQKLKLHTAFTVGAGDEIDFVYDIAPHKAGKSGKYILKPVISESGTGDEVEIHDVDGEDRAGGEEASDRNEDQNAEDGKAKTADEESDENAKANDGGTEADDESKEQDEASA